MATISAVSVATAHGPSAAPDVVPTGLRRSVPVSGGTEKGWRALDQAAPAT
jgi:hypothetical protein